MQQESDRPHDPISRRRILRTAAGTVASATIAGCTEALTAEHGGSESQREGEETSLRVGQALPPVDLDPVTLTDVSSAQVAARIFEGLYTYDDAMELVPMLAADTPEVSEGGGSYVVELRDDARFQNGAAVTADDVVYSFRRPKEEGTANAWEVGPINTEAIDDRSVKFSLDRPYPAFDNALTRPIVPVAERRSNPGSFGRENVIGSGAFELEAFAPGKHARLSRWDGYWGSSTPSVERVTFVPVHSDLARATSLRTAQNDIIERIPPKLWSVVEEMPNTGVYETESFRTHLVGFNCNEGPTSDPRVREAVAYCFDMDEFVSDVVEPTGRPQHSPIPNRIVKRLDLPLGDWKNIPRGKDLQRSKRLLEEAGVTDWSPNIAVPGSKNSGDKLRETLGVAVAQGLGELGFRRARVVKYPASKFLGKTVSGVPADYQMFIRDWSGAPDPDAFLYPLFHENSEGRTNGSFYAEEAVMNDILAARRSAEREKRRQLYASVIEALLDDWVSLPAYTLRNTFGVKSHVDEFEPHRTAEVNPRLRAVSTEE